MDRVIVTVTNLWKWFQELLPGVKWDRLQTRAAHFTFLAAALGAVIFLIVQKYRLSKRIRDCKEKASLNRPAKEELKKIKRKSKYGTLAGILLLIILSIVLVYFVYPLIVAMSAPVAYDDPYDAVFNTVKREKLLRYVFLCVCLICIPLWLWSFSRRTVKKGLRIFMTVMLVFCLIAAVPAAVMSLTTSREQVLGVTADDMVKWANRKYRVQQYEPAQAVYDGLLRKEEKSMLSREDLLNNLALTQMQLGENEEALATMLTLFHTGEPEEYHVINLLVAAHLNGISSSEILQMADASFLASGDALLSGSKKDYVRVRNAVAYNIAYMDMELDEDIVELGSPLYDLIPDLRRSSGSSTAAEENASEENTAVKQAYTSLQNALALMQSDCKSAYGSEDSDITELAAYLEARRAGGVPVVVGN